MSMGFYLKAVHFDGVHLAITDRRAENGIWQIVA